MNYNILVFESTHQVLKAEKTLQANKIRLDIIPTPKDITSECGMSIRISLDERVMINVREILSKEGIKFTSYEKNS